MTFMNSRHSNMRFTCESETDNCIHFIGLNIVHKMHDNLLHGYETSVYRKPTSTALCMNYNSFIPLVYRLSVLKILLYRAFRLCSNWNLIHMEIAFIRSMLLRNAYPGWLLDRVIKLAVSQFVNPIVKCGPRKEPLYIGLPFLGKSIMPLRTAVLRICKEFIPTKDIIIYHKPGRRISSFFRIKDATPLDMRSCVVYQYTCAECQSSYIGQTTRHLRHRIAEHAGVSHLTGNTVKSLSHSSIRDHCLQCSQSTCKLRDFKVLASGCNSLELLVRERLLIDKMKPSLNGNAGSFDLLLF